MYERKTPEPPTCPHNPGVVCRVQVFCEKCGWNPAVEKKRKERKRENSICISTPVPGFDGNGILGGVR